jgi:hypothetical protein
MALSDDTRRAISAYDSFSDFARCPDLLWPPDTYERLDDEVAQIMLRAFCYAWAAGQQAAGVYDGSVTDLADELFDALDTWDPQWTHQRKVDWTRSLGVKSVLLQSDQRPPAPQDAPAGISRADLEAVEDMAAFFKIEQRKAHLLFQIGRALGTNMPYRQAEVGGTQI